MMGCALLMLAFACWFIPANIPLLVKVLITIAGIVAMYLDGYSTRDPHHSDDDPLYPYM